MRRKTSQNSWMGSSVVGLKQFVDIVYRFWLQKRSKSFKISHHSFPDSWPGCFTVGAKRHVWGLNSLAHTWRHHLLCHALDVRYVHPTPSRSTAITIEHVPCFNKRCYLTSGHVFVFRQDSESVCDVTGPPTVPWDTVLNWHRDGFIPPEPHPPNSTY